MLFGLGPFHTPSLSYLWRSTWSPCTEREGELAPGHCYQEKHEWVLGAKNSHSQVSLFSTHVGFSSVPFSFQIQLNAPKPSSIPFKNQILSMLHAWPYVSFCRKRAEEDIDSTFKKLMGKKILNLSCL